MQKIRFCFRLIDELIVLAGSVVRSSSSVCRPASTLFKHVFFSETTGPFKAKPHIEYPRSEERMFVRRIWVTRPRWPPYPYVLKTLLKSSRGPKGQWPWGLECSIGAWPNKVWKNYNLGLTLNFFTEVIFWLWYLEVALCCGHLPRLFKL